MQARELKARAIVAAGKITRGADCYVVPSQNGSARYRVVPDGLFPSCSCPDFELSGQPCQHLISVRQWIEEERVTPQYVPSPPVPRKTYRQQCSQDNAAETNETRMFQ